MRISDPHGLVPDPMIFASNNLSISSFVTLVILGPNLRTFVADRLTASFDDVTNITFNNSGWLKKRQGRKILDDYLFLNLSIKTFLFSNQCFTRRHTSDIG